MKELNTFPQHVVTRFEEDENGDLIPVKDAREIACTAAKAATLAGISGLKFDLVTQYPKDVIVSGILGTGFTVSFTGTSEATQGYTLEVSTNSTFTALVAGYPATLAAGVGTRTYAVTGLTAATNYWFRVKSLNTTDGNSRWSKGVPVKTSLIRSIEVAATSPFLNWNLTEVSGAIATDNTINGRNGTIVGTVTYGKTAIDTGEAANKSIGFGGTNHVLLDGFAVQSGQGLGFGFSVDYRGTGVNSGRLISFHNTANANTQVFVAKSSSTIKARVKIQNASGSSLLDTETNADYYNNSRNNISVWIVGNAYAILVNGVVDKSGTFASQASNAFDFNRVILNGFGASTIANRGSGDYGRTTVWFGGAPNTAKFQSLYSAGVWV